MCLLFSFYVETEIVEYAPSFLRAQGVFSSPSDVIAFHFCSNLGGLCFVSVCYSDGVVCVLTFMRYSVFTLLFTCVNFMSGKSCT